MTIHYARITMLFYVIIILKVYYPFRIEGQSIVLRRKRGDQIWIAHKAGTFKLHDQ